ncbi:MAG: hypothetical protein HQL48_11750, partial [Gammaproteobacteria bacterium]|nr:hypothetical protein [Gammaproteobacteria bacterium]
MAKRKGSRLKSAKGGKVQLRQQPVEALQLQRNQLTEERDWLKAITIQKELLRRDPTPDNGLLLAELQLQQSRQLAQEGKFRDAALQWESRSAAIPLEEDPTLGDYLGWLIAAGRQLRALNLSVANHDRLQKEKGYRKAESELAVILLSDPTLRQNLDPESPWLAQLEAAEALLEAYCQGASEEALREPLRQISYQSPYRLLVLLIKALLKREAGDEAALEQILQRLGRGSPFARVAQLLQGREQLIASSGVRVIKKGQEPFFDAVSGVDGQIFSLLSRLQALTGKSHGLFELMLRHHHLIGTEYVRQQLFRWLPLLGDEKRYRYEEVLGSLTEDEDEHYHALLFEEDHDLLFASEHWEAFASELDEEDEKQRLIIADALHRSSRLLRDTGDVNYGRIVAELLNRVITLDPRFYQAYLDFLNDSDFYSYHQREIKTMLDLALRQFPEDLKLLLLAMANERKRKSYKKAVALAQRVLALDPINVVAREMLIASHLGHFRKVLKQRKFHLVDRELLAAARYQRGEGDLFLTINRALAAYVRSTTEEGLLDQAAEARRELELVVARESNPCVIYMVIDLQAKLCDLDSRNILSLPGNSGRSRLKVRVEPLLTTQQPCTGAGMAVLLHYLQQMGPDLPSKVLEMTLDGWRKPLLLLLEETTPETTLQFCHFLWDHDLGQLLEALAKAAFKRWDEVPAFRFYQYIGMLYGDRS